MHLGRLTVTSDQSILVPRAATWDHRGIGVSMRNPSLKQLKTLVAVLKSGTVSHATRVLGISQPTASKLISELQTDIDPKLLDRDGGRLVRRKRIRFYEEVTRVLGARARVLRELRSVSQRQCRKSDCSD